MFNVYMNVICMFPKYTLYISSVLTKLGGYVPGLVWRDRSIIGKDRDPQNLLIICICILHC